VARLTSPVGYWNGLALLLAFALPLALWIAGPWERPRWLRASGVLFAYAAIVALLLTVSRAGIAVAILAVVAWLVLGRPRFETAAALVLAAAPAVVVGAWAFSRPGLTKDHALHSARVHDGALFAVALVLGAAVAFGASWVALWWEQKHPLGDARRRLLGRIGLGAAAVAVVIAAGVAIASGVTPARAWHKFNEPPAPQGTQGAQRLGSLSSRNRGEWWREAWRGWKHKPVLGSGAGTFGLTHLKYRTDTSYATEPHNLPLQFLTETGIFGLLLLLAFAAAAIVAILRTLRRLEPPDALAATALAIGAGAYALHSLVDFDWDFVALSAPFFLVLGLLLGPAPRPAAPPRTRWQPLYTAAPLVLAGAIVFSLLSPWLAARKVDSAYSALFKRHYGKAVADARSARSLNPAALDPLLVLALAQEDRGQLTDAASTYARATRAQPENAQSWFALGYFEFAYKRRRLALKYLARAAALDPQGLGGELLREIEAMPPSP
jgi:O-antigen ligase